MCGYHGERRRVAITTHYGAVVRALGFHWEANAMAAICRGQRESK